MAVIAELERLWPKYLPVISGAPDLQALPRVRETKANCFDTVEWLNKDIVDHTSTEKKTMVWNVLIAPGKSAKVVMKKAGTFDYYCRYHPNMVARIVVAGAR